MRSDWRRKCAQHGRWSRSRWYRMTRSCSEESVSARPAPPCQSDPLRSRRRQRAPSLRASSRCVRRLGATRGPTSLRKRSRKQRSADACLSRRLRGPTGGKEHKRRVRRGVSGCAAGCCFGGVEAACALQLRFRMEGPERVSESRVGWTGLQLGVCGWVGV